MKKIGFLLPIIFLFLSCSEKKEADWTIIIYMAADNSLNYAALNELEDMKAAEFSDKINVIVQIDYNASSEYSAHRYKITPESKKLISSIGEIDSGDADQLASFVNWGKESYPAKKYALVIWGHGNGWYSDENAGFCSDDESGNYIHIARGELRSAFQKMKGKLDITILDACNMQTLEIAAELEDHTDFLIASEGGVHENGFPYKEIFSEWENYSESRNLAEIIAFQYHYYYWFHGIFPIACSVIDLNNFHLLTEKITEFVNNWKLTAQNEIFSASREECLEFNEVAFFSLAADVDVKELFVRIQEQSIDYELQIFSQEMLAVIDSTFHKTEEYPTGFGSDFVGTGLIWFPDQETQGIFDDRKDDYEDLEFAKTGWLDFLINFFGE